MPSHTITISEKTNQRLKVYKAIHDLKGVSEVVEKLAEQIVIPGEM
jgi:predicted CopG family antitoxin